MTLTLVSLRGLRGEMRLVYWQCASLLADQVKPVWLFHGPPSLRDVWSLPADLPRGHVNANVVQAVGAE